MQNQDRPIAFFDSGLGGISVLRETVRLLPQENYLYYGDSLHAPYGVRPEAEIRALAGAAAEQLVQAGAKALVVACNTATSAAIVQLREAYPDIPGNTDPDMGIQSERLILCQNTHVLNAGVHTVGNRQVDNTVLASKRNSRLCEVLGKNTETAATAACQQHCNYFLLR